MLADAANTTVDGRLNVLGAFDVLVADKFPYIHHSMMCIVKFAYSPAEYGRQKEVEILALDTDGKQIGKYTDILQLPEREPGALAWYGMAVRIISATFPHPGRYAFHILAGGEEKWVIPIEVVEAPSEEANNA